VSVRNDLQIYEREAGRWWDESDRYFRSLRSVGNFHVELMRRAWSRDLAGARLADLGCGGGHAAIELSRMGAHVTGIDRSSEGVKVASERAREESLSTEFRCADLRDSGLPSEKFDFVIMTDVLEHIEQPEQGIQEAARLLRPGGALFVNTFNRTWCSRFAVVTLAERLGLVPRGTHDGNLFVRPGELESVAVDCGLHLEELIWERPALLRSVRNWSIHLVVARRGFGYSAFLRKAA